MDPESLQRSCGGLHLPCGVPSPLSKHMCGAAVYKVIPFALYKSTRTAVRTSQL